MLEIIKAKYHTKNSRSIDVTEILRGRIKAGGLNVIAGNELAGDPDYGTIKRLTVRFKLGGEIRERVALEGKGIIIMPVVKAGTKPIKSVDIKQEVQTALPMPRAKSKVDKPNMTDIIVPSYNQEKFTIACFESIKANTEEGTYRIIWVDNGSKNTKAVKAVLKDVNHIAVLLKKNYGYWQKKTFLKINLVNIIKHLWI
jgi:hypothetical protein